MLALLPEMDSGCAILALQLKSPEPEKLDDFFIQASRLDDPAIDEHKRTLLGTRRPRSKGKWIHFLNHLEALWAQVKNCAEKDCEIRINSSEANAVIALHDGLKMNEHADMTMTTGEKFSESPVLVDLRREIDKWLGAQWK